MLLTRRGFPGLQVLHDEGLFESQEEAELRESVLGKLSQIVEDWIKEVARVQGQPLEDANARIFTFGSFRLGVHGPGEIEGCFVGIVVEMAAGVGCGGCVLQWVCASGRWQCYKVECPPYF